MSDICEAIESVLKRNVDQLKLVVSDNGSTDGTKDYLRSLNDSRTRIYVQPLNRGIMKKNLLLASATASIARILSHDDRLLGPYCSVHGRQTSLCASSLLGLWQQRALQKSRQSVVGRLVAFQTSFESVSTCIFHIWQPSR